MDNVIDVGGKRGRMISKEDPKIIFNAATNPFRTSMKDWITHLFMSPSPSSYVKQLLDQLPFVRTLDSLCGESPEYLPLCISWAMEDLLNSNQQDLPIGVIVVATIFTDYDDESIDLFYENLSVYNPVEATSEVIDERIWRYIKYLVQIRV